MISLTDCVIFVMEIDIDTKRKYMRERKRGRQNKIRRPIKTE